jgi:galactoside O-acetyltransferase
MAVINAYLSQNELAALGCAAVGNNVLIHRSVVIVNPRRLTIGSDIRIDAFSVLTCGDEDCTIGDHVHISTHVLIAGRAGFDLKSYVGISSGCRLFSTSDDFSGGFLTGPTLSESVTNAAHKRISIGEHAVTGSNSVVIPGGDLGEGAILGALSLAKSPLEPWFIYAGVPAHKVKPRSRDLLKFL